MALAVEELAELEEATTPAEVYPNWFSDWIAVDAPAVAAMGRREH